MLSKPAGFVWTVMLGVAALLIANTTNAVINLDTTTKGVAVVTYAMETLLTTGMKVTSKDDGKTYYEVVGQDSVLNVAGKIGLGGFSNTQFNVKYELHGMAFATAVVSEDLNFPVGTDTNILVASGGAQGDSQVTFAVQRDGEEPIGGDIVMTLMIGSIGVYPGASGGVAMTVTEGTAEHMASYPGAVRVARALKEAKLVDTPTATVADGFMKFGEDLMASVGSLWLSYEEAYLEPNGDALGADALDDVIGPDGESSIVFSGDFSFASMVKLSDSMTCVADEEAEPVMGVDEDLLQRNDDGTVKDMRELTPVMASTIGAAKYLCIFVRDPDDEDAVPIPATGKYMVATKYGGIPNAAFPPSGTSLELGYIMRDGTTVQIPYLTQFGNYNQRIVIVNRGAAADYSFSFTDEEDGPTITRGADASGTLAGGATTYISLKHSDLVTIDGSPNRVSATLIVESEPHFIDVVVSQTNANGGTDTVRYTDN